MASGDQMMLFFWKGDQLAVKRAKTPATAEAAGPSGRPWTSTTLPCREPSPMPGPADFSRFLANALAFTSNVNNMSLFYNEHRVCHLQRKAAPPQPLSVPRSIDLRSPGKMMSISTVQSVPLQLDCTIMREGLHSLQQRAKKDSRAVAQSFASKFLSFASSHARKEEAQPKLEETQLQNPAELLTSTVFIRIVTAKATLSGTVAGFS